MSGDGIVSRVYGGFRGVDFRGDEVSLSRSPDSLNVWRDYRAFSRSPDSLNVRTASGISTRPGLKSFYKTNDRVYGIFFIGKNGACVHAGKRLYLVDTTTKTGTVINASVNAAKSNAFGFEGQWYFMDGVNFLANGTTPVESYATTPKTSISRSPLGGGELFQDINRLSALRTNTFVGDGESKEYFLDDKKIDTDYTPHVKVDGAFVTGYTVDYDAGKITFETAPSAPLTRGQDNVEITFKKAKSGDAEIIKNCTLLQVFDNRVFASGNPKYPNTVFHCALSDPTYWSDTDYYDEGMDKSKIRSLVAGNNALWVFREPSPEGTSVFYHTPVTDPDYGKIYPSSHSNISIGCTGRAVNFSDDIVFFSDRGMEGISGDITSEQLASHRSTLVDSKLITSSGYGDMVFAEWEGYLLVFIGKKVYLADSRAKFANGEHYEYDWFYWELEKEVYCTAVQDGVLYLGCDDGVYTLDDFNANVKSYWTTPKDKFNAPSMLKTTNKRGCVVEALGDVTVYAKTEKTGFELIGDFNGITDYFACKIKRKKFKDLQLRFYSEKRFSLETATLEAFVGGYIKR